MIRKQDGFSLVELMVTLVIFTFVIVAATGMFIPLVNQFKQQSRISETNIEGIVGLEILRSDLDHAGFGLPWYFPDDPVNAFNYTEATVAPANTGTGGITYNDSPNTYPPRPVVAGDNLSLAGTVINGNFKVTGIAHGSDFGSDYLVIKSTSVAGNVTAQKWTYIINENEPNPKKWNDTSYDLTPDQDRVIVIKPRVGDTRLRELAMDGPKFFTKYSDTFPATFSPSKPNETFLIYGVDPSNNDLQMPFNRADYYVGMPTVLPQRCAVGTGILYKAVLSQAGTFLAANTTPLLDCVADLQVVFGLDMDHDGIIGTYSNADGTTVADATKITGQAEGKTSGDVQNILRSHSDLADYRSCLQEVRVYILAHDGQRDPNYTYPNSTVIVGPTDPNDPASLYLAKQVGRTFDFTKSGITKWENYRWKLYTVVVKLRNTR